MKAVKTAEIRVETLGDVPQWAAELATAKVSSMLKVAAEPVLSAHVTLAMSADPAVARPAVAQATIDMNGRVIRAQAAQETLRAAVEQMADRLRLRLGRSARNWEARRGTTPAGEPGEPGEPGEWRHQSIPADRPPYFPRPADERSVIRRASFAASPETVDEAVAELDLLDYDFHLFTERTTRQDSVVYRTGDGYHLVMAHPKPVQMSGPVTVSQLRAPRLTVRAATERLEGTGESFTFFIDAGTGRGSVLYHRYDGHYGLLGPAGG